MGLPTAETAMISLTAQWTFVPGQEARGMRALQRLARQVQAEEPGTLTYLVHTPAADPASLPPGSPQSVTFFEVYADRKAFLAHVTGPLYTRFVRDYKDCFVQSTTTAPDGEQLTSPFVLVQFLTRRAGFGRASAG